jgi:hypothetical protein
MVTYHFESKLNNEWYACTFVQPHTSFKGPTIQLEKGWAWFLPLGVFAIVGFDSEIVQLAAKRDNDEFNRYILPKKPIHPKSSEVTGLYSTGAKLYYKGQ